MTKLQHIETAEVIDLPELIKLQSANANQLTSDGNKGDWLIKENVTGNLLFTFPPMLSDALMFQVLNFARKFELEAFNEGIRFQKNKQNEFLSAKLKESESLAQKLIEENERLATILDKHIGEN